MIIPTLTELYLAFRQAKIALFFEKRGVGLVELARYENNLGQNLRRLRRKLVSGHSWFDGVPLGEVYIVPKKLKGDEPTPGQVLRTGSSTRNDGGTNLEIQIRLSPSPDFAILEILFLREFGPVLDSMLSKNVIGYRLDIRSDTLSPTRRSTFEYWHPRYQEFRTAPLMAAKQSLASRDRSVMIISADLASFYDSVDPTFLMRRRFVAHVERSAQQFHRRFSRVRYEEAAQSLLRAYGRFRGKAEATTGLKWPTGIPIGALTSRVVANLALLTLDNRIEANTSLVSYRRYVDDMVVVMRADKRDRSDQDEILAGIFPIKNRDGGRIALDAKALRRSGCDFEIQRTKVRIHHLSGVPGDDFLNAVTTDFQRLVSEQRALLDNSLINEDEPDQLITATQNEGSPLRVLRDADRIRLARFALSTHLRSLERISILLDSESARSVVSKTHERLVRALGEQDNWVEDLDLSLRLLRLALTTDDAAGAQSLVLQMDAVWKTVKNLRSHVATMEHRGRRITKLTAWTSLRDYMHARRLEAISSALTLFSGDGECLPDGVAFRRRRMSLEDLQNTAVLLARADLRDRDREDDTIKTPGDPDDDSWLRSLLKRSPDLSKRMDRIGRFVARCRKLSDTSWQLPPARLFLCTRPPSYFDIARRWLYQVEHKGFTPDVFEVLLRVVNAVRGTEYRDPVGEVLGPSTVQISPTFAEISLLGSFDSSRIVMANLPVSDQCFDGALTRVPGSSDGNPVLTWPRLRDLAETLEKARVAARGVPNSRGLSGSLLLFPELSIPRSWLRLLANHTVNTTNVGLVVGLEYLHDLRKPFVLNQVMAVLPGPFRSVATWHWTKLRPARIEEKFITAKGLRFQRIPKRKSVRTVVRCAFGDLSVLICSEMLEAERVADLFERVDLVLVPSWNKDTTSYEHVIQAVGLQMHAFIAIANNGQYSDCRAWGPFEKRFQRDLCRLIERDCNDVVSIDLPMAQLRRCHRGRAQPNDPEWLPLPPGMNST